MLWLAVLALAVVLAAAITLPHLAWRLTRKKEPDEVREHPDAHGTRRESRRRRNDSRS